MEESEAESDWMVAALGALAHGHRLAAYRLLVEAGPSGVAAGVIAERLGLAPSSLSFHMQGLLRAGLVAQRRESRHVIYAAEIDAMNRLVGFLLKDCCGRSETGSNLTCAPYRDETGAPAKTENGMTATGLNILFLCTANSARSIMAERLLERHGGGRLHGFSAGSHPAGTVNPLALRVLADAGLPTAGLRSKSWDEFAAPGAPRMDFVFTVCDDAAGEVCPVWPGHPVTAHWGVPDPAAAQGSDIERFAAFLDAFRLLDRRIGLFAALPFGKLERASLQREVRGIGRAGMATQQGASA